MPAGPPPGVHARLPGGQVKAFRVRLECLACANGVMLANKTSETRFSNLLVDGTSLANLGPESGEPFTLSLNRFTHRILSSFLMQ